MKRALICGVTGQDGAYLAQLLLGQGYEVYGTSRDAQTSNFEKLAYLGIKDKVRVLSMSLNDFRSVLQALVKVKPDEIYNLAGQTSVGLSFEQPVEALESILTGTVNLLESIRFVNKKIRFYNAGSSECFGDTGEHGATEESPFRPRSPYAVAKAAAHWEVANYREAYDLYVCSGIVFNHESPLRPERFVTRKIISAVCRIASGSDEKLYLGNLAIRRDWGWAPEYVVPMWKMLQKDVPDDYVISTGIAESLENLVKEAFMCANLDWQKYVVIDDEFKRPTDIGISVGDSSKANHELGWKAKYYMKDVVRMMYEAEMNKFKNKPCFLK